MLDWSARFALQGQIRHNVFFLHAEAAANLKSVLGVVVESCVSGVVVRQAHPLLICGGNQLLAVRAVRRNSCF